MRKIFYIFLILIVFSTCKKDEDVYTTKNAVVTNTQVIDTTFHLQVFPNPCNNLVTLSIVFPRVSSLKITAYDMMGRNILIPNGSYVLAAGTNQIAIETTGFTNGIYFLRCEFDRVIMNTKIIVQH